MFLNELSLLTRDEIYNMKDSELKSFEFIKLLITEELKRLEKEGDEANVKFLKKTLKNLIILQDTQGTGHNLD